MDDFRQYLQQQKYTARTINKHCNNVKRFMDWLAQENDLDVASVISTSAAQNPMQYKTLIFCRMN